MKKIFLAIALIAGVVAISSVFDVPTHDQGQEKVYVALEGEGKISVLDAATRNMVRTIDLTEQKGDVRVLFMPHNVQVAPDNKSVWVTANAMDAEMKMSFRFIQRAEANEGHGDEAVGMGKSDDEIIVIDPFSDAIVKRIELGQDLHLSHVALTSDSSYAIVASQEKGIIYKINTNSFEVEKEVATKKGGGPHGLRISPDGKTAYIAMLGGKSLGVLDIASFSLRDIPLKGAAVQTGVTPNGKYALVSVYDAKSLAVYDIASAKLSYIDLPKEAKGPVQIYPTPDSRYLYVADQGYYFDQPTSTLVYRIDVAAGVVDQTIPAGSAPHGIVVDGKGNYVYVTNLLSDDLSVIEVASGKEVARIPVGKMPNGVSVWSGRGATQKVSSIVRTEVALAGADVLSVPEKSYDFGTISMAEGKVSHAFKIKNTGSFPVTIKKLFTSCMCTTATLKTGAGVKGPFGMKGHADVSEVNTVIASGEEAEVGVVFDPAAHGPAGTGEIRRVVYVETEGSSKPLELTFEAVVAK